MKVLALAVGLVLLLSGCEEQLTVPGHCPEFCVGGLSQVHDTVIMASPGSDSTYVGYTGWADLPAALASAGLPAGETRAWYRFPRRPDSVSVSAVADSLKPYTIDSVAISVSLVARDTTLPGLVLYLHRIPVSVDTLTDFATLDGYLTAGTLIDSIVVPDSLKRGPVKLTLKGSALDRLVFAPEDSGRLAIAVRLRDAAATGVRLGTLASATGTASYATFVTAEAQDSTRRKQTLSLTADGNGYVRENGAPPQDPDLLWVGRTPSARSLIRFAVPRAILDSSKLLRVTLELTPAQPLFGLLTDPAGIEVRDIIKDIGAKSTPSFLVRGFQTLAFGGSEVVGIDVMNLVLLWKGATPLPQAFLVSQLPEGGSFHQPVFFTSRSAAGAPLLRITYSRPAAVETP
jgi:hypothetical protein